MSNLLPLSAQRAVWRRYLARLIVAGSLTMIVVAFLSGLALLPGYLALHSEQRPASDVVMPAIVSDKADREAAVRTQALIATLAPLVSATTTPTEAIAAALALRPNSISIDHVVYTAGTPSTVMLVGMASAREAINAYRQALAADPQWKSVSVPVGDLTGAPGGRFSVTLSRDF